MKYIILIGLLILLVGCSFESNNKREIKLEIGKYEELEIHRPFDENNNIFLRIYSYNVSDDYGEISFNGTTWKVKGNLTLLAEHFIDMLNNYNCTYYDENKKGEE